MKNLPGKKNLKNSNEILYRNVLYYNVFKVSRDMQLKWIFHGIGINLLSSIYSSICSKNLYLWITIIPQFAKSILDILMFELDINLRSIFSNSSIRIFESFEIFRKTCTRIFQVLHFEVTRLPISKFFTILSWLFPAFSRLFR